MGNKRIIILFFIISLLAASLLFFTRNGLSILAPKSDPRVMLFDAPLDTVDHLTIEHQDSRIGLIRQDNRWVMTAPFSAEVDQPAVLKLLDALENARINDFIRFDEMRRKGLSLQEFGLMPPVTSIILESGRERTTLSVGFPSALKNEFYLRLDSQEDILVLPSAILDPVPKNADGFRSLRLTDASMEHCSQIDIKAPGKPFISIAKDSSRWLMKQPFSAPALSNAVSAILNGVRDARLVSFVWPTVSNVFDIAQSESALATRRSLYGLDDDRSIQLKLDFDDSSAPLLLRLGKPSDTEPALTYILTQNGDAIGLISNSVANLFNVEPQQVRDLRLFTEPAANIQNFKVSFNDTAISFERTQDGWRLKTPVSDNADQKLLIATLQHLLSLDADSVGEFDSADDSQKTLSEVELGATKPIKFKISSEDVSGENLRLTFDGSHSFYRIAATNVPAALINPDALLGLRDKTLLSVPAASIRRITLKRGEAPAEKLERADASTAWTIPVDSLQGQPQQPAIDALITQLGKLLPEKVVKLSLTLEELENYGFRKPWAELSVDVDEKNALRKSILIGNPVPDSTSRYAILRGQNTLTILDEKTCAILSAQIIKPL